LAKEAGIKVYPYRIAVFSSNTEDIYLVIVITNIELVKARNALLSA